MYKDAKPANTGETTKSTIQLKKLFKIHCSFTEDYKTRWIKLLIFALLFFFNFF